MIAWIVYGIVVGILLAIAAQAAQSLARLAGAPVRWVWTGAMLLTLSFVGLAPYRETASVDPKFTVPGSTLAATSPAAVRWMWSVIPQRVVDVVRRALVAPIERGVAVAERRLPATVDSYLIALWLSVSSVASLPEEERRELAEYLRGELALTYRMRVTTDVYWTRLAASYPQEAVDN